MRLQNMINPCQLFAAKLLLLTALLGVACAGALAGTQSAISPQAQAQIAALLAEKASWAGAQRKMESHLIQATKLQRGQVFAPGAPNLKLDLKTEADGRILVDIDANVTDSVLTQIKQAGGTVIGSFPQFNSIRALVTLDQVESLANAAGVRFIRRAARAMTNIGSVTSEGDLTHRADLARSTFGVNGQGVKIGVLSDSIDFLYYAQSTGDLGDVTVLPGQGGVGSGEGTAMLEIIHDLAPGAQLYFATAFNGEASFAQNILDLRSNGCQVIIDDVYYFDESPFQDAIIARAVNQVAASGALYFSAAGNDGNLKDGTSGTWEGDFSDGGPAGAPMDIGGGSVHRFGNATFNTVLRGGYGVDLFWADPLGASTNDYDLFLLDSTGTSVVASSLNLQDGTQDPYENLAIFPQPGDRIVIVKTSGAGRFLHLVTSRGALGTSTAGATRGHSAAANAFGVAAVDAFTSYPNPFGGGAANPVETFSSDGPRRIFFNADGSSITPGNYSSTGGAVLQKPDLAAADGVSTSLYYFDPFFGTSAAAPHAGAIAALLWSYVPTLTPTQVRGILTSTALDIEDPGVDRNSGAGIVMAYQALQGLPAKPVIVPGAAVFLTETCLNGALDPGERVTVGFMLTNLGPASTTNLVATLLNSGGIASASGPQTYGTLGAGGGTGSHSFSFSASGACGNTNVATLQLQDGAADLGTASFSFRLGKPRAPLAESFDGVTPPALPAGWAVSTSGTGAAWKTVAGSSDTLPNSAFAPDPYGTSDNALVSPVIPVNTASAQLSFRQNMSTANYGYDGGVLEISVNGGAFADILAAGGSFVTNGYYAFLYTGNGNPLGGRSAWTGSSGGFVTTLVNLPASAAGQNVQLRWRFGSSSSYGGSGGWYIDTVALTDGYDCCVPVLNDIAVGVSDSPGPAVMGGPLTYTITVVNSGPATANGVMVTDVLPPGFDLQSLTVSPPGALNGHGTSGGGTLNLNVGSIPGGMSVNITVNGSASGVGLLTNQVSVTRSEPDGNPANNSASVVTVVTLPRLSINDVRLFEGNSGTTNANFTVNLSAPLAQAVQVHYATSDQTARAGKDYVASSGTLAFAPGETNQTIAVAVIGNTINEPDKTFRVTLSSPTNAALAKSLGIGTILNDDPLPNLSIGDATVTQPDSVTTNMVFSIKLSTPSAQSISVNYFTSNSTATAGTDYAPVYATLLTFSPGETNKTVTVVANDHASVRPQQTFYVVLGSPFNAKIARGLGLGTIITAWPGHADHFAWSGISSPQSVGGPFKVTLTAQDYYSGPANSYNGRVAIGSSVANGIRTNTMFGDITPTTTFNNGGTYTVGNAFTPNTDIVVTHIRHYFGTKVSLWTDSGVLLASQLDANAGGAWLETALPTPVNLSAGKTYRVAVYTAGNSYSWRNDQSATFADGTISQGYETGGDGFPVSTDTMRWWLVDIRYTLGSVAAVPISPATSGFFANGVWTGTVTVQQPGTNLTLQADDGRGHTGASNPFDVQTAAGLITSFAWNPVASPQTSGAPFAVTVMAQDFFRTTVTNFNGAVALSAAGTGVVTNTILSSPSYQYYSSGAYTFGYSFTPSANLTVTHVRHYFGTKVSIWTDTGVLLASRIVTSVPGTWKETPLVTPIQLTAGTQYRVGVYTGGGNYYWRTDMGTAFAYGSISQSYETPSDGFPNNTDSYNWMFVDLKYTVSSPMSVPVGVTPAISANFVKGVWRGTVAVERLATGAVLSADDGLGHVGSSNPFDVAPGAGHIDHLVWSPISSPQAVGEPISVSLVAQDYYNNTATNFTGSVNLSGSWPRSAATNTILSSPSYQYFSSGYYTLGYAFTPSTNLTVTHVRHFFGTKVSIWSDDGVLLASQSVTSVPGTWTETPLSAPIQLTAGARYRVGVFTGGGNYYYRTDMGAAFAYGRINQSYETYGDAFPSSSDSYYWMFADLKYTVSAPSPIAITPAVSGSFSNGLWTGSLTVTQAVTNLVLQADDGVSHIGSSNPFNVAPRGQVDHFALGPITSPQSSGLPFSATITALDPFNATATNFNGPVGLSASGAIKSTKTILSSPAYQYYSSGTYTLGYAFTPATNITVTHFRHYFGTKVSIWTDAGLLLTSRSVSSVPGVWVETPLAAPIQLTAGRRYRVGVYTAGGNYYYRTDMSSAFAAGTIDQSYEAFGDAFPSNSDSYYWMFVDLRYDVAAPVQVALSPAHSGNFTGGVWSGSLAVPQLSQPISNVVVRADDGRGHVGSSNPFDMTPGQGQIDHLVWAPVNSPQAVGEPFTVTITAQDYYNSTATNFSGPVALSGSVPVQAAATSIISYEDYVEGHYFRAALSQLGLSYQAFDAGNESAFFAALANADPSTTLVIVDSASDYHDFSAVVAFVSAGGRAIFEYWNLNAVPSIAAAFNASVVAPMFAPQPVYDWGGSQLFAGLPNPISFVETGWNIDGDRLNAIAGGTAVGGFVSSPAGDQAALIVGNSGRTILNGFLLDNAASSSSAVGLAKNEILALSEAFQAAVLVVPKSSGIFSNGVWQGNVTLPQAVTNVTLLADDGQGHTASSNPFSVAPRGQLDHFGWSPIASPQSPGLPFGATLTAQDSFNSPLTSFNGSVAFSASGSKQSTNTMLSSPSYQYLASGLYTIGYAFTPKANLTVTHVRHYFGTKVSIWTDAGVLVAARSVASTPGTWRETQLAAPVLLKAGTTYRIGVYTGGGNYYYRTDMPSTFADGTINQGYETSGDAFPSVTDYYYWMFVDLKYTVATPVPVALSPANSSSFSNGVWSGNLAVAQLSQPLSNVVVRADDGNGHIGLSNPFLMVPASGQIDHLVWSTIPSPQVIGAPFAVTLTAQDYYNGLATNFTGAVSLSGSRPGVVDTNTILAAPSYQYYSSGVYTFGYAFTPSTNLTVTHVRHYFGSKVTLWTDAGVLLASRAVTSVPGNWVETPLSTPVQLTAGTRYRVAIYTAGGNYYYRTDMGSSFAYGTISQSYELSGDGFPNSTDSYYWMLVDLKYTVSAPLPVAVTPSISGNFANGSWSGSAVVTQGVTGLTLQAADAAGHRGPSNPFDVIPAPQPPLIAVQPASRVVFIGSLAGFNVLADGTAPLSYQWRKDEVAIPGATDALYWIPNAQTNDRGRYSVLVTNLYGYTFSSNATLTVASGGNVVAWGDNSAGQTSVPAGLSNAVAVAGGYGHSLALRNDGTVVAWGDNTVGQTNLPAGLGNVVAIAAGYYHSLALLRDGTVSAWGDNSDGQINVPLGLNNVVAIAGGGFHSLALRGDGTVVAWGYNGYGQASPPAGLNNVVGIAGGGLHSLALRRDGSLAAWGYNADGETNVPPVMSAAVAAAGGRFHSLAVQRDGRVAAWGYNGSGQATTPTGLSNAVAVAGGGDYSLALCSDGTVKAWGNNLYGQTAVPRTLANVAAMASGYSHSLALVASEPPRLLTQPQDLTVVYGANAVFGVSYSGTPPLSFQWQKNGTDLAGATAAALQLPGVTRADEAIYRLIITNLVSSITSSNARLHVLVPQQLISASKDPAGGFHIWFADGLGGGLADPANIQVLAATDLLSANTVWTLVTNPTITGTNGKLRLDVLEPGNFAHRYYRIIER